LSPRNSNILSDSPTFQWTGMDQQPGTVKVFGPQGEIWSAQNINLTKIAYPATAPSLLADVEYAWSIEKKGVAASKTTFKLLGAAQAQTVKERLAELGAMPGVSKTTLAVLKANLLMSKELFHDAREILTEAIGADTDEPTLHFVLGELYDKIGLKNLATEEYNEAEFLAKAKQ
jgi:predicted Zn-dependent protease